MPASQLVHRLYGPALAWANFEGSQTEYHRYLAMCSMILSMSKAKAVKHAKSIRLGRHTVVRTEERFWKTGSISNKTREAEARVYTDEPLEEAYQMLIETQGQFMNFQEFYAMIQSCGHFNEGGSLARFSAAFKAYCKTKGTPLTVGSTQSVFFLATDDIPKRAAYSRTMLDLFKKGLRLANVIFADEVSFEHMGHPKGQ